MVNCLRVTRRDIAISPTRWCALARKFGPTCRDWTAPRLTPSTRGEPLGLRVSRCKWLREEISIHGSMSALGQKRTLRLLSPMSALPPKADIGTHSRDVRFVPGADILRCGRDRPYSSTSSARARTDGGTARPSALAVLRLITSSYLVGACTGKSAGLSPLRMRST